MQMGEEIDRRAFFVPLMMIFRLCLGCLDHPCEKYLPCVLGGLKKLGYIDAAEAPLAVPRQHDATEILIGDVAGRNANHVTVLGLKEFELLKNKE